MNKSLRKEFVCVDKLVIIYYDSSVFTLKVCSDGNPLKLIVNCVFFFAFAEIFWALAYD